MITVDMPTLRDRLAELADSLGAKAPGESGIKVWVRVLKEHSIEVVVEALDRWSRSKTKFPAPADIAGLCANRRSEELERRANAEKMQFAKGSESIMACDPAIARLHLAKIQSLRWDDPGVPNAFGGPPVMRTDLKRWAHVIIDQARSGHIAPGVRTKCACEALGLDHDTFLQDPELIAERAAIQSESA